MYEDLNTKLEELAENFKKGFQLGKKVKKITKDNLDLFNFLIKEEDLSIKFITKNIEEKTGLQLNAKTMCVYFYEQRKKLKNKQIDSVKQDNSMKTINNDENKDEEKKYIIPIIEKSNKEKVKNKDTDIKTNENGEHMFFEKLVERGMLKSFKDESKNNDK